MAVKKEDTPAGAMAKAATAPDPTPPAAPDTRTVDADADRLAELERENADLRRQLAAGVMTHEGVVRLETSETPPGPRRLVISEGVAYDLQRLGKVTDPGTGYVLVRDDETGEVSVTDRAGRPVEGVELAERRG